MNEKMLFSLNRFLQIRSKDPLHVLSSSPNFRIEIAMIHLFCILTSYTREQLYKMYEKGEMLKTTMIMESIYEAISCFRMKLEEGSA